MLAVLAGDVLFSKCLKFPHKFKLILIVQNLTLSQQKFAAKNNRWYDFPLKEVVKSKSLF